MGFVCLLAFLKSHLSLHSKFLLWKSNHLKTFCLIKSILISQYPKISYPFIIGPNYYIKIVNHFVYWRRIQLTLIILFQCWINQQPHFMQSHKILILFLTLLFLLSFINFYHLFLLCEVQYVFLHHAKILWL